MSKISLAFRSFFALLFEDELPPDIVTELGLAKKVPEKPAPPPAPLVKLSDGALQFLGILQRDGRLLDFFMEDIDAYSDEQVGSAARGMHGPCREALNRYLSLGPVIDGVEGTFTKAPPNDPGKVKFIGNVPGTPPAGGILRHRGWLATSINLPALPPKQEVAVLAPAELEVE